MRQGIWRLIGAAIVAAMLAGSAQAGIREYNEAMRNKDYARATTEAVAIWTTFDRTRPETATIAREFAWTAMLAGQVDTARTFATFLVEEGARLPTPDDDPAVAKVLLAWASIPATPTKDDRARLSAALAVWAASGNRVGARISAAAAIQLYRTDWFARDWEAAERNAKIAEDAAAHLGAEGLTIHYEAKIDGGVAHFLRTRRAEGWMRIADAMEGMIDRLPPPRAGMGVDMGVLEPVYFRGHVWMETIAAYFRAGNDSILTTAAYKREGDAIVARGKTLRLRCGTSFCRPPQPPELNAPLCKGRWNDKPEIKFPFLASFGGMQGTVMLRLTTDNAGKVIAADVLAAVPDDVFTEAATTGVRKWTLKRAPDAAAGCTLAGVRDLQISFLIAP